MHIMMHKSTDRNNYEDNQINSCKEDLNMRIRNWLFISLLMTTFLVPLHVQAHYVWMDPGDLTTATIGDTVSIDVYLHATENDGLLMWSVSLGFDDANVDGGELTYESITYNPDTVLGANDLPIEYSMGTSETYAGESLILNVSRSSYTETDWLTADQDWLLFTATFIYQGGIWDGEDVWIEYDEYMDGLCFDNTWTVDYLDVQGTPDYAAAPVPAAVWLLGSGVLALAGIRRKKAQNA